MHTLNLHWAKIRLALVTMVCVLAGGIATALWWPDPPDSGSSVLALVSPGSGASLLTHGEDVPLARSPNPAGPGIGWPCEGDGTGGKRVQVMWGYLGGAGDIDAVRPTLEQVARQVETIFAGSSQGRLLVRFVTEGDCALSIIPFRFSDAAGQSFDVSINELATAGHNRPDRKYLLFMDAGTYCGIGTVTGDDQPGPANAANGGPSYARVGLLCRNAVTAAHELVHNLGGVQLSAANSTGGWHCNDGWDVMCYADGSAHDSQRTVCPDRADSERLDCRDDDYFAVAPAPGSYLASKWNVATSDFLAPATSPTTAPPPTTVPPPTVPPTTSTTTGKGPTKTYLAHDPQPKVGVDVMTYAGVAGACKPTGTVTFLVSGRVISRQVLGPGGVASVALRFTKPGRYTIRATYDGNADCAPSTASVRRRVTA